MYLISLPLRMRREIVFSNEILKLYIPAWEKCEGAQGLKYLALIMTQMEGFEKGSRSFKEPTIREMQGIQITEQTRSSALYKLVFEQIDYLTRVANGQHKAYPLGKLKIINPYYSPEITKERYEVPNVTMVLWVQIYVHWRTSPIHKNILYWSQAEEHVSKCHSVVF